MTIFDKQPGALWSQAAAVFSVCDSIQNVVSPNWRNGNGRPKGSGTAEQTVLEWRQQHPDGRKVDCIRETGLSKPTVYRWWDSGESLTLSDQNGIINI